MGRNLDFRRLTPAERRVARALYIHWPFCLSKCPYCDFNSHVREGIEVEVWREALLADLRHEADFSANEALDSVFFGGGTPSLMPPMLVSDLLVVGIFERNRDHAGGQPLLGRSGELRGARFRGG
jgi:coproporphyrinogen III oxidase-like Fe-S oxidoreductase